MNTEAIATEHATRLSSVDPLLPRFDPLAEPERASEAFRVIIGDSGALGFALRSEIDPSSSDSLWRALVEHRLSLQFTGPDPGECLTRILSQWDEYLTDTAPPGDWDVAAVVPRPSRDTVGSAELLRHGFAPLRVLAVRPADRLAAAGPPGEPGVRIRPAEPSDLRTAVSLYAELQRYDAEFGSVTLRENATELLTADMARELGKHEHEPTVWIAELYGRPLGLLQIQHPADTGWISPYVSAERVGYLSSLHVAEAARSSGVGTALAAHAHQLFDEAGVDAVLLHHALANPTSTPFWYGQGYRPLWTYWHRRPAVLAHSERAAETNSLRKRLS
ncbi:GNAT family N-acetyltransferase [Amycolatopsis acidicola]|uniref:GNAT family N-acetyltransferase n=1 Tax=Amycolatopsis acidicola TaxID=2596893 RepID=A0A5N0V984_9PSEU|nr:GNAT family N-acetyltransferase [Amycolatopsis acidicola]KAA9162956.1 GNAT family N-acetyltransferase [Amycolatopsis acidicola]